MTERAALYARISEDPLGLERGVGRQIEDGRALAEARGWEVVGEYVDNDITALRGRPRERYADLMAAVDRGEFARFDSRRMSVLLVVGAALGIGAIVLVVFAP